MSALGNAHQTLYRLTDRGVEFLWQWVGVKRRHVFTAMLVFWQGSYIVESLLGGHIPPWWLYLCVAFLGVMNWTQWRAEAKAEARETVENFNGIVVLVRESKPQGVFMVVIWVMGLLFLALSILEGALGADTLPETIASVVGDVTFVAYQYAYWSVLPTGPRKKIKLPKLSLPKIEVQTPAPAYGGSWG